MPSAPNVNVAEWALVTSHRIHEACACWLELVAAIIDQRNGDDRLQGLPGLLLIGAPS